MDAYKTILIDKQIKNEQVLNTILVYLSKFNIILQNQNIQN